MSYTPPQSYPWDAAFPYLAKGITSGALPTVTLVSGTGAQIDANFDRILSLQVTATGSAGTVTVALSPDNVTYTNFVNAMGTGAVAGVGEQVTIPVPKGWYVKVTVSNCTIVSNSVYF